MKSLMHIHLCGNIDEPTLNTEIFEICKYFEDTVKIMYGFTFQRTAELEIKSFGKEWLL